MSLIGRKRGEESVTHLPGFSNATSRLLQHNGGSRMGRAAPENRGRGPSAHAWAVNKASKGQSEDYRNLKVSSKTQWHENSHKPTDKHTTVWIWEVFPHAL